MSADTKPFRIGIVANEVSGDILGAALIQELKSRNPDIQFEGVAGPRMLEQGCNTLHSIEKLSVMGLVEVLSHLPEVLSIRRQLKEHFLENPPDLFIGIDAPDFNLKLERDLKRAGITTVHYVCPSIWAWRSGRVKGIRESVDMVLSLFPFEQEFLQQHSVPATHVGHPLADVIPLDPDKQAARKRLGLDSNATIMAILPGSRASEIKYLSGDFIRTAKLCWKKVPEMKFLTPLVNESIREQFENILRTEAPDLPITLVDGNARDTMEASDVVLTASGTATLEALLLKRPMVIAYRLHWLSHWIFTTFNLIKSPFVSLANMLAGREIAPELIQDAVNPESMAETLLEIVGSESKHQEILEIGRLVHEELRQDASSKAADTVLQLIQSKKTNLHESA